MFNFKNTIDLCPKSALSKDYMSLYETAIWYFDYCSSPIPGTCSECGKMLGTASERLQVYIANVSPYLEGYPTEQNGISSWIEMYRSALLNIKRACNCVFISANLKLWAALFCIDIFTCFRPTRWQHQTKHVWYSNLRWNSFYKYMGEGPFGKSRAIG